VGYSRGIDSEFGVGFPFWAAETVADEAEEAVITAAEEDVSVFGFVGSVWDD
jgi:hypothetical protein